MTDTESDTEVSLEDNGETKNILYDIVTYKEWEQEPEIQRNGGPDRSHPASTVSRLWRSSGQMTPAVPASIEKLRAAGLTWQLAVSPDAGLMAVMGDTCLEVWSSKDNYTHLLGRRPVEKDPAPHWRHVLWTRDCQLLALASSSGHVEVCDTVGGHVYHVISPRIAASQPGWADRVRSGPLRTSYAGVFFTEVRLRDVTRDSGWVSELVVCEVSGAITSFLVSVSGYQELSRYDLGWSVTSAALCPTLGLLITSGSDACPLSCHRSLVGKASHAGLVTLRLVSQEPHYVLLLDEFEQSLLTSSSWLRLPSLLSPSPPTDPVLTMTVSECGGKLAAVHVSGSLTVWRLPSLVLESSSRLEEQPQFDEVNPALLQHSSKRKAKAEFLANPLRYHPVGVSWWSKDNLVVARISGAVTVLQMTELDNLLGDNPEFLEGVPRISQCFQKGFFALECELVVRGRRVSAKEESAGEDPDEDIEAETDEEEEDGWLGLGKRSAAALAYFVTDSERFAPPKKKSKVVRRTYRLLALVSTSPEELYNRKILLEEYGEAIMLAQHYGLDTDSVYRRQWQQSNKSGAAIQDYLTKIRRRNEVVRECLETIPDDIDAARELLKYGLRATDLEALVALNTKDDGVLVLADIEGDRKTNILRLISQVRWESLTLSQKELMTSRVKMLYYLDCLDTLEEILGGGRFAAEKFTPSHFRQLRSHSPLENCALAARRGDTITVECLMAGSHAGLTSDHWLAVISNFPETLAPSQYSALLPRVEGGAEVGQLYRHEPRAPDWCEGALASKWGGPGVRREWDTQVLYTDQALRSYTGARLTPGQVSQWYCYRARRCVTVTSLPDTGQWPILLSLY